MTTSVTALTIPPWLTERGIIAPPSGGKRHRSRQELYDELRNALSEAIREGDRDALNGFIESEVLYHIAPADIPSLWDVCRMLGVMATHHPTYAHSVRDIHGDHERHTLSIAALS